MQALASPRPIQSRGGNWALVNVHLDPDGQFVFGRLARYLPEGRVDIVDPNTLSTESQIEPNLLVASVPFVYIPAHSGIAFLAGSSNIDHSTFIRRFCSIIEGSLDNFFVECQIEVITDLRALAIRVSALDAIYKIQSRVSPPNPLFGPLWENLKKYLIQRNADRLNLTENAGPGEVLQSMLPELASSYTETAQYPSPDLLTPIPVGDAAILMAVDGYGAGIIRGRIRGDTVVIRTSETIANFSFDKDPTPEGLYSAANEQFDRIRADRYMEHG
jgi:hypothetical protein